MAVDPAAVLFGGIVAAFAGGLFNSEARRELDSVFIGQPAPVLPATTPARPAPADGEDLRRAK